MYPSRGQNPGVRGAPKRHHLRRDQGLHQEERRHPPHPHASPEIYKVILSANVDVGTEDGGRKRFV